MNIWLVTTGEPVQTDGDNPRLLRTGIFAEFLVKHGQEVTWWQSAFSHAKLEPRFLENKILSVEGYTLVFLKGKGYKKNISLDRIIDHYKVAQQFKKVSIDFPKPDIIVCSFPTFSLCEKTLEYGKKNNVPVLIDYRDLWPETFVNAIPQRFQVFGKIAFIPMFSKARNIFKRATGIISITEPILNIALEKVGRAKNNFDNVFPLGYRKNEGKISDEVYSFWKNLGIESGKSSYVCYFGKIGHQFELDTVIDAAKILAERKINITFVLCGNGDKLEYFKAQSENLTNVIFSGYINAVQIRSLMQMSQIGIAPYFSTLDFNSSLPNKAIEYMSEGLTIVTSLKDGYLGKFVTDNNIGYCYSNGNPTELADLLVQLSENKENLERNKNKILEIFEEKFKSEKVYNDYMLHLQNTIQTFKSETK